jgi:hypothetical protein
MNRNRIALFAAPRLACLVLLLVREPASAQQMDMAVYQKWAPVVVVHYVVVGEYMGEPFIAGKASGVSAKATVKDRVELTFDWDQGELALVGQPVLTNFPSTLTDVKPYAGCGVPHSTGTYEHATYGPVTAGVGALTTTVTRNLPATSVGHKSADATACGPSVSIPAATEATPSQITVAPPIYYAQPETASVRLSADKRSVIMTDGTGWTWTYTMTAIR